MIRKIIEINSKECNGCGLCAKACHEGAIQIINHKAVLIKDDYCDGLGDCLPHCPKDAIHIITREANDYDEQAVLKKKEDAIYQTANTSTCKGSEAQSLRRSTLSSSTSFPIKMSSQLIQWPCQLKLVPLKAPYFDQAHLLLAADCTAYAYANFHHDFMQKRVTLIGCPKLDAIDYSEKLTDILSLNTIKSVTLIRMEVPCCKGLEMALVNALKNCRKEIPYSVRILSITGEIIKCY